MAFNADEYIDVIVGQIAGNFQELSKIVERKKELDKKKKAFKASNDSTESAKLSEEIKEEEENYRNIEPLTVGLFGEWGSGKTHLLKLIENKVNEFQADSKDKTFPQITIPVFFNAWRFEKEEHMIIPLFQTMLTTLEEYEHKPFKDEVKTFIRRGLIKLKVLGKSLSSGLKSPDDLQTTALKAVSGDVSAVTDVLDTDALKKEYDKKIKDELVTDELFKELTENSRLESVYYKMPQWIEKITLADNINFIFLIDDLDRCLPENTLKMLESIKLFLDVPSCAFVLAIDDDVVERGVAYHYRDYLQNNNNIVINLEKKEEEKQENSVAELPITGHEYLEKMVQLPFRIPVITHTDVLAFLQTNYEAKFKELFKDELRPSKELYDEKGQMTKSDEVMKFFAQTIPPKPRKIKRTAMLFQTKVKILQALKQHNFDHMLVAKLTLLELFAPKLLRFIQNNNYKEMFDILYDFSNLVVNKYEEEKKSLENSQLISTQIKQYKNEGDRRTYTKLLEIVEENYHSRMVFRLDPIFNTRIDKTMLTEVMEQKVVELITEEQKELVELISKEFYELLFGETETQWRKAFDDNELFEEGKALLTPKAIEEITRKSKNKQGFCDNPKWLLIIAEYITQPQFVKLLEAIYPYKMNPYQITFEEYDKYCEATGIKKPNDEGWGRGRRPVINVSWEDATAYAKWLSGDDENKYRLPTEDEWYLACNVGAKTKWYFGDDESELKNYAWYRANSYDMGEGHKDYGTHVVGSKGKESANALGLYDMHGNVWEWCEDWYDKEEKHKVLRGGSWDVDAYNSHASIRSWYTPDSRDDGIGFRLLQRT